MLVELCYSYSMNEDMKNSHLAYMKLALALAKERRGFCAPNPAVGALVVKDGVVLAEGKHWAAGQPHAERDALNKLEGKAKGTIMYVTLEPCCHFGKTPPCTQGIIDAGIERVYYGFQDPNPTVGGKGAQELIAAGIPCEQVQLSEIDEFYQSYSYWLEHRRPFVTGKIALSFDGKIAGPKGKRVLITGKMLQRLTHEYRRNSDALLTTANTIIHDDPELNVRLDQESIAKRIYILDSQLRLPLDAKVLTTASEVIIFHEKDADEKGRQQLRNKNIRCVPIQKDKNGMRLKDVIKTIGEDGIHDLWVESGGRCFQSLVEQRLLNRALIYLAPKILGPQAKPAFNESLALLNGAKVVEWESYGEDAVCRLDYN